jgi:hypothetical protein
MNPVVRRIDFWLLVLALVGMTALSCRLCQDVRRYWPLILLISVGQAAGFVLIRLWGVGLAWTTAAYDAAIVVGWYGALLYLEEGCGGLGKLGLLLIAAGLCVLSLAD